MNDSTVSGSGLGAGPAPASVSPALVAAYARADAEARAALALLSDPSTDPSTARVHLVRGLEALAAVASPHAVSETRAVGAGLTAMPSAWAVDGAALAARYEVLSAQERARAEPGASDDVADGDVAAQDARPALRDDARALVAGVRAAEHALYGDRLQRAQRRRVLRGVGLGLGIAIPVIVTLVLTMPSYREGPWRGEYYATKDFTGESEVRRDNDIRFEWDEASPTPEFPKDKFSIRWDTCLLLERPLEIAFRLTSDDGSRLLIDGERVLNNWGAHGERTRGERVAVEAGLHHMRVEYFDDKADASVALVASLQGERPEQIPVRILHYPGDDIDPDDPCGAVRASLGR